MNDVISMRLRGLASNQNRRGLPRVAGLFLVVLMTPVIVSAYTVVLRSGRHLEIPAEFTVTARTLTYEASPGMNVTLLISTIDIAATERANNESAGALLRRVEKRDDAQAKVAKLRAPRRELTQADIENARLARDKSEQEYDRRRKELGLPSLEESRLRTQNETQRMVEDARQVRAEERESEGYWRARASALRSEFASIEGQVRYIRARLSELPDYSGVDTYGFATGGLPIYSQRPSVTTFPAVTGHPGFMRGTSDTRTLGPGFLAFQGPAGQRHLQLYGGITRSGYGRYPGRRGFAIPAVPIFGAGSFNYDVTYERANLVTRLRELEAAKAGIEARWRFLEEEARRAGAQPVWLRP